jgi:hypothetical protein
MSDFPSPGCKALMLIGFIRHENHPSIPLIKVGGAVVEVEQRYDPPNTHTFRCEWCGAVDGDVWIVTGDTLPYNDRTLVCECKLFPIEDPDAEETTREAVLTA